MRFPDISEYYKAGNRAELEEKGWGETRFYERNAALVNEALALTGAKRVLEVACGSGWVPTLLPNDVHYTGVDKLPYFIELSRRKNPGPNRLFLRGDLRELLPTMDDFDLVCSFATLKHFGLYEWDDIVRLLLSKAPVGLLEAGLSVRDFDNGTDFHHVFVTHERMEQAIRSAGHEVVDTVTTYEGALREGGLPDLSPTPNLERTYFTRKLG